MHKRLMSLGVAVLVVAGLSLAAGQNQDSSWIGWVTETSCGARGDNVGHADCAKKCVESKGAKYALYNSTDKKVYVLDPQDKAAAHAGHHVTVKGTVQGDTIKVSSIEVAPEKPKS